MEWKAFRIDELFEITLPKGDNQADKLLDGNIPLISSGMNNNGITKFILEGDEKAELFKKNIITVDMFGKTFQHNYNFYSVSHGRINILSPKFNSNSYILYFIITSITESVKNIFSYNRMCSQKRLSLINIFLPIDSFGNPNWQFMEEYIKQKEKKLAEIVVKYYRQKMDNMIGGGVQQGSLENVKWEEFSIKDIFNIKSVKGKPINNYVEGKLPYITTSAINNGVNEFVSTDAGISDENCISIDPIGGKAFYHGYTFVGRGGAGSAINLLYINKLNKNIALFLCRAIEKTSLEKASYAVALNGERLKNAKILLPIDSLGNPNWKFMESYIKNIEAKQIRKILRYLTYTYI